MSWERTVEQREADAAQAPAPAAPHSLALGARPHVLWALLGGVTALGGWFVWTIPGAIAFFAAILLAFAMWRRLGSRGSWMALIVLGFAMSGILGWQAATGARCPEAGTKVFLKFDKPPIGCGDVRASTGVMSAFFGMVGLIGLAAPIYARRLRDEE